MAFCGNSRYSGINDALRDVTYGNGHFLAVGRGHSALTSANGKVWSQQYLPTAVSLYGVAYGDHTFVVVGGGESLYSGGSIITSSGHFQPPVLTLDAQGFLSFETEVGINYQLDSSLDLWNWNPLTPPIEGVGTRYRHPVQFGPPDQQFFRATAWQP